jgi:Xaa-Pro aminopeptidase
MHSKRIKNLQKFIGASGLDKVLITDKDDIYYYTGYRILNNCPAFLIIDAISRPMLLVSPLDNEAETLTGVGVFLMQKTKDLLNALKNSKTIGYDEHHLTADLFLKLKKSNLKLKSAADIIKKPRSIKDEEEIKQIKHAIKITRKVFGNLEIYSKSEIEVAHEIETSFLESNATSAFSPIIASGPNSYFVHHVPANRKIKNNDLVIIDIGARFNHYCSDITRTFCLKPCQQEKKIYMDIIEIQGKIIDKIRDGVRFNEIQKFYEACLKRKKYKPFHGFGHGIGLSPHESIKGKLKKGMVITIEPGIYIKGFGGCRIEDMILIKKNKPEVLSKNIVN